MAAKVVRIDRLRQSLDPCRDGVIVYRRFNLRAVDFTSTGVRRWMAF